MGEHKATNMGLSEEFLDITIFVTVGRGEEGRKSHCWYEPELVRGWLQQVHPRACVFMLTFTLLVLLFLC